ncbi:tetratricopeptide repeat protein [Vibrio sp. 05-20-BW147]|uniref:tetratricopeptide repeat protein n=1 Tax=Vibrio sp. 05-20-BW147 TaxID=2575834 RepID=UPI001592CC8E|nr:tetratricopeptide repeat protein [Vibrio sp. 05-20-BW147]NVC64291.1 tetratricopeptide repeat protein [Vibrio sp. 05-20-BW147]
MNKRILTLVISMLLSQPILAGQAALNVSDYAARAMQQAQQLADDKKVVEAIKRLESTEISRADDIAALNKMLGLYYWQEERFDASILSLEKALKVNAFPSNEAWFTRRMLAQLYLTQGEFKKAIPLLQTLLNAVPQNENEAEIWRYLAQAQYSVENWQATLKATQGFQRVQSKPDSTILSLALAANVQLEQWKSVVPIAKQLISLQPNNKNWWLQAYNAYLNLKQEKSALDMLALAELQGISLNESEIKALAYLYAGEGIYLKAAQTLARLDDAQHDLQLLKLQAQYWQTAKEWESALSYWQKAAMQEPKYLWEVAILQNELKRYQQVIASLDTMQNPQRQFDGQMLKINALYRLDRLEEAYLQAKKADAIKSTQQTTSWLNFLSHKMKASHKVEALDEEQKGGTASRPHYQKERQDNS